MKRLICLLPAALLPLAAHAAGEHCAVALPVPAHHAPASQAIRTADTASVALPHPVMPKANAPEPDQTGPVTPTEQPAVAPKSDLADRAHPTATTAAASAGARSATPTPAPAAPPAAVGAVQPLTHAQIDAVPALKRIASAGATLYPLGMSHGMRAIFARAADGKHFQVFYVTPDGTAEIGGIMWDAVGTNITLAEVRAIPGVMPTMRIGAAAGQPSKTVTYGAAPSLKPDPTAFREPAAPASVAASAASILRQAAETTHGTVGQAGAPRVWMLMDPLCMFSQRAMQELQPFVDAGKVRVSVIPLSILDYEDHGVSTKRALVMVSQPGHAMVSDWIDEGLPEQATQGAAARLSANMAFAQGVGLRGTPTFLWQASGDRIARYNGLPPNIGSLVAMIEAGR
jgi:thiol:disulfide interchange protein DsbG